MTPGVKFSTTTSAVRTNACTMARASGALRFSVRLRLPMLHVRNDGDMPASSLPGMSPRV